MKIAVLTKEQGKEIFRNKYSDNLYFNPVLDADMNIIISEEEVNQIDVKEFIWATKLELKTPDEVLKGELTKEQYYELEKLEAEKRLTYLTTELDKLKQTEIKK